MVEAQADGTTKRETRSVRHIAMAATSKLKIAVDAIAALSSGSMHGSVYNKLESARRKEKAEKMKLWEDQDVF